MILKKFKKIIKRIINYLKGSISNPSYPFLILIVFVLLIPIILLLKKTSEGPAFKKTGVFSSWEYQASLPSGNITASAKTESNKAVVDFQYQNSSLQFDYPLSEPSLKQGKNNEITFTSKDNNIQAQYQIFENSLKESIILYQIPASNEFISNLKITNADVYLSPENLPVFLHPQSGEYLFHIQKPYAVDAAGNKTYALSYQLLCSGEICSYPAPKNKLPLLDKLIKLNQSQSYQLVIKLDSEWLNDPDRVFPLIVDPTIVHDTSSEFATGQLNRVQDTGSGSSPSLESHFEPLRADQNTVALWHLNEASGNVLDSSGNGYTGAPTDTTIVSGINGFGNARYFDGVNDMVTINSVFGLGTTNVTIECWVNLLSNSLHGTFVKVGNATTGYGIGTGNTWFIDSGNNLIILYENARWINTGVPIGTGWHHVALVINSSGHPNVYLDGVLVYSDTIGSPVAPSASTGIGGYNVASRYINATIDEVRISNIARTSEEILLHASHPSSYSTYTSDILDLSKYPVWDSLSWTGTGFTTGDGETLASTTDLVAQWNFNETSGTAAVVTAGSCGTSCNGTLTSFASTSSQDETPGTGWTANNRRWGAGALIFDGTNDYVDVGDRSELELSQFTASSWVKVNKSGNWYQIMGNYYSSGGTRSGYKIAINNLGIPYAQIGKGSSAPSLSGKASIVDGEWHFLATTFDGTNLLLYVDAVQVGATTTVAPSYSTYSFTFAKQSDPDTPIFSPVIIDSSAVYSRVLTAAELLSNYNSSNLEFQTRVGSSTDSNDGTWEAWRPTTNETAIASLDSDSANWGWDNSATYMPKSKSNDTIIKQEGTSSLKIESGVGQTDANTVGLWHLDETSGSGAYIRDSSSNANHGTPTGTNSSDGIINKARSFNGSSDFITLPSGYLGDFTGGFTLELWANPTAASNWARFIDVGETNSTGNNNILFYRSGTTNDLLFQTGNGSARTTITATSGIINNEWHYYVATIDSSGNTSIYRDGEIIKTGTAYLPLNVLRTSNYIGKSNFAADSLYTGYIDDITISNVARTAEEIAENYRLGRDHRISRTISSTNLSSIFSLPFYVASDRAGSYLDFTIGESAYANYEPDANTVGFWHLDEQSGSGAYIKDVGSTNHGTLGTGNSAPSSTQGKIGKARNFGGNDYINIGTSNYQIGDSSGTFEAWFSPTNFNNRQYLFSSKRISYSNLIGFCVESTSGKPLIIQYDGAGNDSVVVGANSLSLNIWNHVAYVSTGTEYKIYLNGVEIPVNVTLGTNNGNWFSDTPDRNSVIIGALDTFSSTVFVSGILDEVRISNIARSADEIRQAYEVGKRTHSITIDFSSSLSASDLVSSSTDYSFTLDDALHLYLGDKIIIKENIGGTEYFAQGTVNGINSSAGAVTVSSWDSGSTFPTSGFTASATVFKWQREYFNITGSLSSQRDATTYLTYRITDGSEGANIWLDDLRSSTGYLNNSIGSTITSSPHNRYFQYRTIFTQNDLSAPSSSLTSVTLNYFSSLIAPNCLLQKSPLNNSLIVKWLDSNSEEDGYIIEKKTDDGTYSNLTSLSAGTTAYTDNSVSSGHTYQYRIAAFYTTSDQTAPWCETPTLDLGIGSIKFEGIKMEGLKIN